MEHIPWTDEASYEMLQKADTLGVFQLESSGMRQLLKNSGWTVSRILIAVLAMYRPGSLGSGMVDQYIQRASTGAKVEYLHPLLRGCPGRNLRRGAHQSRSQRVAILEGYSPGRGGFLRELCEKADVMEQQRAKFVEGKERGIDGKTAENIFNIIQEFAGYGFNKSHSAAYALITYQTAWLKANYRPELMAAYLSSQIGSKKEDLAAYVREVRNSGIKVLPPRREYLHGQLHSRRGRDPLRSRRCLQVRTYGGGGHPRGAERGRSLRVLWDSQGDLRR